MVGKKKFATNIHYEDNFFAICNVKLLRVLARKMHKSQYFAVTF